MNDPHTRRCWRCGHEDTYRDGVLPECACRKCGSADTRRLKSQAEKDAEKATADAETRIKATLAACENMPTESLTPGCVAKLVEALSLIADSQSVDNRAKNYLTAACMQRLARLALAAMKGV